MSRQCQQKQQGFTLIEVLMSVAILSIGIGTVFQVSSFQYELFYSYRTMKAATQVGEAVLEDLQVIYDSDSSLALGEHVRYYDSALREVGSPGEALYNVKWIVAPSSISKLNSITLTVSWRKAARDRQIQFVTYRRSGV